jgi:septin family protein
MKKRATSARVLNADLGAPICPPTTKKHEAMVAMRRNTQTEKQANKTEKETEEQMRVIKAVRLTNRVKKSPALSNNAAQLKKKRNNSLQRARDQMKYLENVYNQQKAIMEFNVANRPLLVE